MTTGWKIALALDVAAGISAGLLYARGWISVGDALGIIAVCVTLATLITVSEPRR